MKKILFVIGQLGFGGAERQLLYLLQGLDRSKFSPVVCSLDAGEVIQEFYSLDLPIICLPRHLPRYDISRLFHLLRLIRKIRPHILHAFLGVAHFYTGLASLLTNIPLIISERNARPRSFGNPLDQWLAHLMVVRAQTITANSHAGAELFSQCHGLPQTRVKVIHNGLDPAPFDQPRDLAQTRKALGIRPESIFLGIVGTLDGERKDQATFLRAIKILRMQCRVDIQAVCAGDGPKYTETVSLARQLGVEAFVSFLGKRTDVPDIISALDILISSSQWEGLPNVVMEAMAAGKPVVATAVGGTPELVVDGVTGFLVPPRNPEALAGKVQLLLENPDLAARMGKAGRLRLEQEFSLEKMIRSTEAVYESLLPGS